MWPCSASCKAVQRPFLRWRLRWRDADPRPAMCARLSSGWCGYGCWNRSLLRRHRRLHLGAGRRTEDPRQGPPASEGAWCRWCRLPPLLLQPERPANRGRVDLVEAALPLALLPEAHAGDGLRAQRRRRTRALLPLTPGTTAEEERHSLQRARVQLPICGASEDVEAEPPPSAREGGADEWRGARHAQGRERAPLLPVPPRVHQVAAGTPSEDVQTR